MLKRSLGALLILVSFVLVYEAFTAWDQLTNLTSFLLGGACSACLTSGLFLLFERTTYPGARSEPMRLPSPYDRGRWR